MKATESRIPEDSHPLYEGILEMPDIEAYATQATTCKNCLSTAREVASVIIGMTWGSEFRGFGPGPSNRIIDLIQERLEILHATH